MAWSHGLRKVLPAVVLVAVIAAGLGAGYYFAAPGSARPDSVRVTWAIDPLKINFTSQTGSGSTSDSFTCSPAVAPVTFLFRSNQPNLITITVTPPGFSTCGATPDDVVVTAACTATARANNMCLDDFSGMVTVCGPTPYTCMGRTLIVVITVTNSGSNGQNP